MKFDPTSPPQSPSAQASDSTPPPENINQDATRIIAAPASTNTDPDVKLINSAPPREIRPGSTPPNSVRPSAPIKANSHTSSRRGSSSQGDPKVKCAVESPSPRSVNARVCNSEDEPLPSSARNKSCLIQDSSTHQPGAAASTAKASDESHPGRLPGSAINSTLRCKVPPEGSRKGSLKSSPGANKSDSRFKHTKSETALPPKRTTGVGGAIQRRSTSTRISSGINQTAPEARNSTPKKLSNARARPSGGDNARKPTLGAKTKDEERRLSKAEDGSLESQKGITKPIHLRTGPGKLHPTPRRAASASVVTSSRKPSNGSIRPPLGKPQSTSALFDRKRSDTPKKPTFIKPRPDPVSTTTSRLRAAKSRESLGSKEDLYRPRTFSSSKDIALGHHPRVRRNPQPAAEEARKRLTSHESPTPASSQAVKLRAAEASSLDTGSSRSNSHPRDRLGSTCSSSAGTISKMTPETNESLAANSAKCATRRRKGAFCASPPPASKRESADLATLALGDGQRRNSRPLSDSSQALRPTLEASSPHEDARTRGGARLWTGGVNPKHHVPANQQPQPKASSPSLWRKALIINKFMTLTSPTSKRRVILKSSNQGGGFKSTEHKQHVVNKKKPVERLIKPSPSPSMDGRGGKLIPRRDFVMASGSVPPNVAERAGSRNNIRNGQPLPTGRGNINTPTFNKVPQDPPKAERELFPAKMTGLQMAQKGVMNKRMLKLFSARTAVDLGITYSRMKVFFERWKTCEEKCPLTMMQKLLTTIQAEVPIRDMVQKSKIPDNFRYSEFFPADLKLHHCESDGNFWLGSINDPLLPDPAYDRKFAAFWMTKLSQLPNRGDPRQLKLDSQETRSILRKLDKIVAFPEETALLLKHYESQLFKEIGMRTLLGSIVHGMSAKKSHSPYLPRSEDYNLFQKLVSHFYLVCEWIVQLIISQPSNTTRREALSCILRFAQASWNFGNFNGAMEILLGLRSPALKPLWISLSGSDADQLFSRLFRKLFCFNSREYKKALRSACARKATTGKGQGGLANVVPAYLLHLTSLSSTLTESQGSCLVSLSSDGTVEVLADFHGENRFLRRLAEPEHPYTSGLQAPIKKKMLQSTLNTVHEVWSGSESSPESDELDYHEKRHSSLVDSPILHKSTAHHGVSMVKPPDEAIDTIEFLHAGTTILHFEPDTHQVLPVFLKLERCNGTVTWCRPPWSDPRRSSSFMSSSPDDNGTSVDNIEDAVSPGLRLKYTNRSGESLAYTDEGYIDLMHMKDLSLSDDIYNFPESVRVVIHRAFQGAVEPKIMRIVFGSSLAENRTVHFLCPPEVADKWFDILPMVSRAIKNEDPRIVWLKDQYLFLFFQDDLCMGPLAADAIKNCHSFSQDPAVKVFGGRSWSLSGMLKDRTHKGSWKGVANNPRTKKKSYGNIHSINDRGIHEIYETFGGVANGSAGGSVSNLSSLGGASAPTSPWSSPLMGRKSIAVSSPLHMDRHSGKLLPMHTPMGSSSNHNNVGDLNMDDARKLNCLKTGSITHGSELSFMEFLDLFKSFSLRLRKDIRTLFANHSVCNVTSPDDCAKDWMNMGKRKEALLRLGGRSGSSDSPSRRKELLCSLTRNSSMDLTDFKSRSDKKKVFDAMAAASIFNNSAGVDTSRAKVIPMDAFVHFLEHFQKEIRPAVAVKALIELHEPDPVLRAHNQLSFEGFARYLMDSANSAIDLNDSEEDQDLDQPLSRYYIATSHNTYLVGHQLKGLSSVQLYREILLTGCRCVELDCWDGDDGHPIIYHGHTLTTKISFQEVVQTIAESAFVSSPLPVVLSIENHCSIPQQQKMAAIFKELLGDHLVTAPISENEGQLPSPNQLRYRIILKNKKLRSGIGSTKSLYRASTFDEPGNPPDLEEEYDSDYGEEDYDDDIQDDYNDQNMSGEDYQQSLRASAANPSSTTPPSAGGVASLGQQRPRTLSLSPSLQLQQQQQQQLAASALISSKVVDYDQTGKKKKENTQIARELSDLVIYCQSVKFKGFGKSDHNSIPIPTYISDSPANRKRPDLAAMAAGGAMTPMTGSNPTPIPASLQGGRRTGLKSLESTPSSSSGSLAGSLSSMANGNGVPGGAVIHSRAPLLAQTSNAMSSNPSTATLTNLNSSFDLSSPIYQCSSLHESRAKTLCRKHSQRMLEHSETQVVRVYPAGMRIDSSNFNPVTVWSCGIQMVAMNYQTSDPNLHMHNAMFAGTKGFVLKPQVMWNPSHILYQRFLPNSKAQEGLHITHISLTVLSGQYVCRENYGASPIVEIEVLGIPRDCSKFKTKMISRNALNPIWEETFEIEVHLPEMAFIRFTVLDVASNMLTAQRVVPVTKLKQGYRHLRLHNELDQPLPLSQLFLCSHIVDGDLVEDDEELTICISKAGPRVPIGPGAIGTGKSDQPGRKRMSFLVVHDISEHSPYAILKVPENATTREVIRQAIAKAGTSGNEHEYVLLEEVLVPSANGDDFITAPPTQQRMVGMDERPLHLRNKWKSDSKFVLKRIGSDPSWRARLGNMIQENNNQALGLLKAEDPMPGDISLSSGIILREEQAGAEPTDETETDPSLKRDVDNFLVCIFNVSSKVSYSILQVPRTSTAANVITLALSKCRRGEEDENKPEKYVLVEETDPPPVLQNYAGNASTNKKGNKAKRKRVLDAQENVYLIQLAWKGAGRLILEQKEKLLKEGQFFLDVPSNPHLNVCETQSDPLSGLALAGKVSPRLRRSSKIIASGVRRISRSFYGNDSSHHSQSNNNPLGMSRPQILRPKPKQRRMTTVAAGSPTLSPPMASNADSRNPSRRRQRSGDARLDGASRRNSDGDPLEGLESLPTIVPPPAPSVSVAFEDPSGLQLAPVADGSMATNGSETLGEDLKSRKLSKVNLRKLKIW